VPPDAFERVAGVRDLAIASNLLRCTVVGPMDSIVKAASRFEIRLLTSGEPSLEEVFLAYYGGRTSDAA
jgi:ABC-2 type transport system ATP-binding protein